MFDIGFLELVLVGVIALLVLGPEKLPQAARTAGKWLGTAKRMVNQVSQEIDREIKTTELREKLKQEGDTLGLEKIQSTVKDALSEAKNYEHLVENNIIPPPENGSKPAPPPQVKSNVVQPENTPAEASPGQEKESASFVENRATENRVAENQLSEKIVPLQRQETNQP